MAPRGKFTVPQFKYHSCDGARNAYESAFGAPWPHDDEYLREIGREFRERAPHGTCNDFIIIMRENSGQ